MDHESKDVDGWIIRDSEENFETWISKDFVSDSLRDKLKKADILIVPIESLNDRNIPLFPQGTENLFVFLNKNLPENLNVDICIEDNDYKELTLHFDLVTIASFVVKSMALPFLINLLSNYIYQKISHFKSRNVKVSITIVNEIGQSKNLSYEGSIDGFTKIIEQLKKK